MFIFSRRQPIVIPWDIYEEMISHAKDEYPRECCGVLVGNPLGKIVFESHRVSNMGREGSDDRFVIDKKEINIIKMTAKAQNLSIIGFYHSHPDRPENPTEYDMEGGEPGYSYIIISVNEGKDVSVKSWSMSDVNEPFKEEGIKIKKPRV